MGGGRVGGGKNERLKEVGAVEWVGAVSGWVVGGGRRGGVRGEGG